MFRVEVRARDSVRVRFRVEVRARDSVRLSRDRATVGHLQHVSWDPPDRWVREMHLYEGLREQI